MQTERIIVNYRALTFFESLVFSGSYNTSTEKIETRAFANCPKIAFIIVPPATTDIAWDAFDGDKGLTILGIPESRAETYAAERGMRFAALP